MRTRIALAVLASIGCSEPKPAVIRIGPRAPEPAGRVTARGEPAPVVAPREPERPPAPERAELAIARDAPRPRCDREHARTHGSWTLRLSGPLPAVRTGQVRAIVDGKPRVFTIPTSPRSTEFQVSGPVYEDATAVDADGTVVFNPMFAETPPNVAIGGSVGIYRIAGKEIETLVDSTTVLPGTSQRLEMIGFPSIEHGSLAFYSESTPGGGGVYLLRAGGLIRIAALPAGSTPSLYGGRVAFVHADGERTDIHVWSPSTGLSEPVMRSGQDGIFFIFGAELGAHAVFAGTSRKQWDRRQVMAASGGQVSVIADGEWFHDPKGRDMMLQPMTIGVYEDEVVFTVGVGNTRYVEAWVASGCSLEKVLSSGDIVGGQRIDMVEDLQRYVYTRRGDLIFWVELVGGESRLVRASRSRIARPDP